MNTARTRKIRQYHHGDPAEEAPYIFYCQLCDLFESREHFEGCVHGAVVRNGRRYQETNEWRHIPPRRWWLRNFEPGDPRQIVDCPGNLFRTETASEQRVPDLLPNEV
jgi:hypothetical protein